MTVRISLRLFEGRQTRQPIAHMSTFSSQGAPRITSGARRAYELMIGAGEGSPLNCTASAIRERDRRSTASWLTVRKIRQYEGVQLFVESSIVLGIVMWYRGGRKRCTCVNQGTSVFDVFLARSVNQNVVCFDVYR